MKRHVVPLLLAAVFFCGALFFRGSGGRGGEPISGTQILPGARLAYSVLGAFRGMAADVLWFRLVGLKTRGKLIDAWLLYDWLSVLQPKSTGLYTYGSRDMAFNFTATTPDTARRWEWVRSGMDYSLSKGIPLARDPAKVAEGLAVIYGTKLASDLDSAHVLYKREFFLNLPALLAEDASLPEEAGAVEALMRRSGMDPDFARSCEARYKKLDWRNPASHALYWSEWADRLKGREATEPAGKDVITALYKLLDSGIYWLDKKGRLMCRSDKSFEGILQREIRRGKGRDAEFSFLCRRFTRYWLIVDEPECLRLYDELKAISGEKLMGYGKFARTLVEKSLPDAEDNPAEGERMAVAYFRKSWLDYALGDEEESRLNYAKGSYCLSKSKQLDKREELIRQALRVLFYSRGTSPELVKRLLDKGYFDGEKNLRHPFAGSGRYNE